MDFTNLRTFAQVEEESRPTPDAGPTLTVATLRWWYFQRHTNGFDRCVVKIGGRLYVDRVEFGKWLDSQRVAATG